MQACRAQRLQWQEIVQKGTVRPIDRQGARHDIAAACPAVAAENFRRAGVLARRQRLPHDDRNVAGIAQAHVQALRPDRGHHMRGLADQRDTVARELSGPLDREREDMTAALDADTAKDRMRLLFSRLGQFVVAQ
jgi:hypothetical protein